MLMGGPFGRLLAAHGYKITDQWSEDVDVFLFNSCTVKGPSQDSFLNMVAKAKSSGAAVVVAGCVPQGQPGELASLPKRRLQIIRNSHGTSFVQDGRSWTG